MRKTPILQQRNNPKKHPLSNHTTSLNITNTPHIHTQTIMAPKRSQNQPGAISQMYTSLASPDNRSVVTAVAFFAVSPPVALFAPILRKSPEQEKAKRTFLWKGSKHAACAITPEDRVCAGYGKQSTDRPNTGRCRFLAQQLERALAAPVSFRLAFAFRPPCSPSLLETANLEYSTHQKLTRRCPSL